MANRVTTFNVSLRSDLLLRVRMLAAEKTDRDGVYCSASRWIADAIKDAINRIERRQARQQKETNDNTTS